MKDRLKEIIDAERWDERLGTLNAINATLHNSALDRIELKVRELLPKEVRPVIGKDGLPYCICAAGRYGKGNYLEFENYCCECGAKFDWSEGGAECL